MLPILLAALAGGDGTTTTTTRPSLDVDLGDIGAALGWACLAAVPLALSLWALLDVVHRPRWAWALVGRSPVRWLIAIVLGIFLAVVPGIAVSLWYLLQVRPRVAAAEDGRFDV